MVLDGKSSHEYPVNVGVPQGSNLGPTFSILYIDDLPVYVICNIAIYIDDTTLHSKCDQASDLWHQLHTVDWGRKWLVDFKARKSQPVLFDWSNNSGAIDVRMDRSVLEEKSSFKVLELTFFSKLYWGSCIISIAKSTSKKIGALIRSRKFLSPVDALYFHKSTIRPFMECCFHV